MSEDNSLSEFVVGKACEIVCPECGNTGAGRPTLESPDGYPCSTCQGTGGVLAEPTLREQINIDAEELSSGGTLHDDEGYIVLPPSKWQLLLEKIDAHFLQELKKVKPLGDDDDEELLLPWLGRGDPEAFRQIAQADRDYVIDQIEGMLK